MGRVAKYTNLKGQVASISNIPNAAAGPYNIGASEVWYFAGVPCTGARQVVWTVRGAGTGSLTGTTTINASNEVSGAAAINATTAEVSMIGEGGGGMQQPGGFRVAAAPAQVNALFVHGYLFLVITNDTNAKTAVSVEAQVWYDLEGSIAMSEFGQSGVAPASY